MMGVWLILLSKGGVPLASSRFTSSSPDCVDVLAVMEAFEEINRIKLTVRLTVEVSARTVVLLAEATAHTRVDAGAEPVLLASRQLRTGYSQKQTMDSAILQLLYGLDAQLAASELDATVKKP